jgi:cobalt-zinc-cadmium efflux system outer membrane protein
VRIHRKPQLHYLLASLLLLSLLAGCRTPRTAKAIVNRGELAVPKRAKSPASSRRPSDEVRGFAKISEEESETSPNRPDRSPKGKSSSVLQASAEALDASDEDGSLQSSSPPRSIGEKRLPLDIPKDLPGAEARQIDLALGAERRSEEIEQIFGTLPEVNQTQVSNSPNGLHYSLSDLQALAFSTNPVLIQAEAQVTAMRGAAIQAGLHPNPILGYEADTVGSGGTPNYHGGYVNTVIKTPGKLDLAEGVANADVWNAELMRKKTHIELITQVRGAYFAALIARENVKIAEALVAFTDSVYRNQVEQLKGGLVSASEPVQLRALAVQARTALAQARNRYDAAWRQLAAIVGTPELPPGYLEGVSDVPLDAINYNSALTYMFANHTDLDAARNSEMQARTNLRLQELNVTPDLQFYMALQKDYTTGPVYRATYNMQIGVPVPIFDRNQGNIMNAQGTLLKSAHEASRLKNDLANRLADSIERYENARNLTTLYRGHILPDQARAFRGLYDRYQQQPDVVGFVDVVNAQQTLLNSINVYISTLSLRWAALTDIGALLQIDSLEGIRALLETGSTIPVIPMSTDHPGETESPLEIPPAP